MPTMNQCLNMLWVVEVRTNESRLIPDYRTKETRLCSKRMREDCQILLTLRVSPISTNQISRRHFSKFSRFITSSKLNVHYTPSFDWL